MNPRRGVASLVLRSRADAHEVLLLRRATEPFLGEWFPIEGGLDGDEPPHAAARREILEETGLVPHRLYRDPLSPLLVPSAGYEVHLHVFVAFVETNAEVTLNEEHSHCEWLSIDEAIARVPLAAQKAALRRVEETFLRTAPPTHLLVTG
jgi:dATP pyrophosphohydrolase